MSLRKALANTPKPQVDFTGHKRVLAQQVDRIGRVWGDREAVTPPPFDLQTTLSEVKRTWSLKRSLDELGRRERRFLPYVLFYPPGRDQEWIGADPDFVRVFADSLKENPRTLSSTAFVLLRDYPRALRTFDFLRERYTLHLSADGSVRTAEWRRRHATHQLFARDGPEQLSKRLCDGDDVIGDVLADAGLLNELASGAFMRHVHTRVLALIEGLLKDRAAAPTLARPLAVLLSDTHRLRFEDQAGQIGNALLLPHAHTSPLPATRTALERFLLTHLLDPRLHKRKWQGVEPAARAIFLRWLVGATLEDFFRLIAKHALMEHWEHRRAFWNAYLRKGVIVDACVVLGEQARELARQVFHNKGLVYARLSGGQRDHSVLLLRIGDLTVAEWSHNGKARIWGSNRSRCPELHQLDYARKDLVNGADHEQVHYGNSNYTWQRELAQVIAAETGVNVFQSEYRA